MILHLQGRCFRDQAKRVWELFWWWRSKLVKIIILITYSPFSFSLISFPPLYVCLTQHTHTFNSTLNLVKKIINMLPLKISSHSLLNAVDNFCPSLKKLDLIFGNNVWSKPQPRQHLSARSHKYQNLHLENYRIGVEILSTFFSIISGLNPAIKIHSNWF